MVERRIGLPAASPYDQATDRAICRRVPPSKRQLDVVLEPVTRSMSMRELDRIARAVAGKDIVVTLIGESGTGKEVLARRIHELSHRRTGPFVPINCAAIPEALFESELFGHEKGAFTGASDRARGKVEAAGGGTLFLDEIGEMPTSMQAKLLRFLENRKFMRVGGTTKVAVDVRLITATLRPIEDEVRAGRFRADLFYRIQGISLRLPLLQERQADIGPLVTQFVAQASAKFGTEPPKITRAAMAAMRAYSWPGNVRELRNAVELLCVLRDGKPARLVDLPVVIQRAAPPTKASSAEARKSGEVIEVRLDQPLEETIERITRRAQARHQLAHDAEARRTLRARPIARLRRHASPGGASASVAAIASCNWPRRNGFARYQSRPSTMALG
jgi:DNA-binding NtrC family response regulator